MGGHVSHGVETAPGVSSPARSSRLRVLKTAELSAQPESAAIL